MPRHGSIADQLAAVMAYRSRPETIEPIQTNWTVVPANDNDPLAIDYSFERLLRMTPSVQEIMRQVGENVPEKNKEGQTVKWGKLRFSDGTNTEQAHTAGPDGDVIQYDRVMPTGAMLGCRENAEGQAGGNGATAAQVEQSNLNFARMLGTIEPRHIKRTKRCNGPSLTSDESRAELAKAISNTPMMPKVTYLKPGLPCAGLRVAESFLGMQKASKGQSGVVIWQDLASALAGREVWEATLAAITDESKQVLETAMEARTLADIAPGGTPRGARKRGARLLQAANANLIAALKSAA